MEQLDLLIACVHKLGGKNLETRGSNTVDFTLSDIPAFAYVQDGGRLRGSVFVDSEVPAELMDEAQRWAATQSTRACRIDAAWVSDSDEDGGLIRLLFERDLDPEVIASDDPLADEADALFADWYQEEDRSLPRLSQGTLRASDPTRHPPTNAWILMGSQHSFPDGDFLEKLRLDAERGIFEESWTAAKQTEPGDLLLFYFKTPRKAVHFVARAADHAYFEDIGETDQGWSGRQWWTHIAPMVEVEPVALADVIDVIGDTVMLGRSGRYVRPEHAAKLAPLLKARRAEDSDLIARIVQPVVGRSSHPDPADLTLDQWRQLAAGSLRLEADVERLIVEPLLRFALANEPNKGFAKAYRAGRRVVDYVIHDESGPVCAVEVKLRVRRSRTAPWTSCKDFEQAADYGRRLSVPAILIDAFDIHLIRPGDDEPHATLKRSVFLEYDLDTLRDHVFSGSR